MRNCELCLGVQVSVQLMGRSEQNTFALEYILSQARREGDVPPPVEVEAA